MHLDAKSGQVYVHSIESICQNAIEPDSQCLVPIPKNFVKVLYDGVLCAIDLDQVFGVY